MSAPAAPFGVILAGGLGTRMGGVDKALVPLAGRPMLAHVVIRLRPQVAAVAVNANGPAERFAAFGLPVLPDPLPGHPGPLAGVLAGLDWAAAQGAQSIVTMAADTPFFPADLVARLMDMAVGQTTPLVLAATPRHPDQAHTRADQGGLTRHPTVGLWSVALRAPLRAALMAGERKVALWADIQGARLAVFPDEGAFFNINTPDDLARADCMVR